MKKDQINQLRFSTHFIQRFIERFGKRFYVTETSPREHVTNKIWKTLSEAQEDVPNNISHFNYLKRRYNIDKMFRGCGIIFFVKENTVVTCIPASNINFQNKELI